MSVSIYGICSRAGCQSVLAFLGGGVDFDFRSDTNFVFIVSFSIRHKVRISTHWRFYGFIIDNPERKPSKKLSSYIIFV